MDKGWETILKVGMEGGSITIEAVKDEKGEWAKFTRVSNDSMIYDEEFDDLRRESRLTDNQNSKLIAHSWEEALELLNIREMLSLSPISINNDFKLKILNELKKVENLRFTHRWLKLCNQHSRKILELADLIEKSKYTVVFTGAGMDTESNIPDFRSKSGWWKNIDPSKVASIDALNKNYELFHEFYTMRINSLKNCTPHNGHHILAKLEERGLIQSIATQNVSGLHTKAGSKRVHELHGNIEKIKCDTCGRIAEVSDFIETKNCKRCGDGKLRPGVTLFGEMLPQEAWSATIEEVEKSKLLIVIGTSLEVYPANRIPKMTKGKTVLINMEDDKDMIFDIKIKGKAKEVLEEVNQLISL